MKDNKDQKKTRVRREARDENEEKVEEKQMKVPQASYFCQPFINTLMGPDKNFYARLYE